MDTFGQDLLAHVLAHAEADGHAGRRLAAQVSEPPRAARTCGWPGWAHPAVVRAAAARGTAAPWSHQVKAADLAARGTDVVVATGTASGKSLCYQLPVLTALATDRRATALYLAPTKALGADQLRAAQHLAAADGELAGIAFGAYDGDTPGEARQWVRAHGRWVFTNPDMLHAGVLRNHPRWARLLRGLRFVVVDESHHYRGVFGSNVALVLRRLRRVALRYGADPVFILASATTADPAAAARRLVGRECAAVTGDGSPRGPRTVALWEPGFTDGGRGEHGAPVRQSAYAEAAAIMAALVAEGARTLTFVRSRTSAELTALATRRLLAGHAPDLAGRVAAYRAGYLAQDRRAIEAALSDGGLLGVATTNALELGVDIAGLDAVVVAGYPGSVASFWQQAGRAGRRGQGSLVILVAKDDPLDTYLVNHPEMLLGAPVEATVIDPANPHVLAPHLLCAVAEAPLREDEAADLGALPTLQALAGQGLVRHRRGCWYPADPSYPHGQVDIRGGADGQVAVADTETGVLLGTVATDAAPATVHPGAVYVHQGETFLVDELHLDDGIAWVHPADPPWLTYPRSTTEVVVRELVRERRGGATAVALAEVTVTRQVVGFLRRLPSGRVLDSTDLDMPPHITHTRAVVVTTTLERAAAAGVAAGLAAALHAAEHAVIALLPLVAACDPADIGGVSSVAHPGTGLPTLIVYDSYPGGAGFAERAQAVVGVWLSAAREAIVSCGCPDGCPSCVQSPRCGSGNHPLDKAGAAALLGAVLDDLGTA